MYNAPVIFALRGSNYKPQTGFELDTEPYVGEYSTFLCFGNPTVVALFGRSQLNTLLLHCNSDVE
jgi:hypothetical protein